MIPACPVKHTNGFTGAKWCQTSPISPRASGGASGRVRRGGKRRMLRPHGTPTDLDGAQGWRGGGLRGAVYELYMGTGA